MKIKIIILKSQYVWKKVISLHPLSTDLKRKAMALEIRGIPVLEGEVARRFIREAKENEKKRGSIRITPEQREAYNAIVEKSKKNFL